MKSLGYKYILLVSSVLLLLACNTAKLEDARVQYLQGQYYAASETYRNYYRKLKPNERALRGVVSYEMAQTYKHLNYPSRATSAYANAIRYNYPDTLMYLSYAQMLHKEGKYELAKEAYESFLEYDSANYLGHVGLLGVSYAININEKPSRYIVKRKDVLNSNRSEFAPMFAQNDNVVYITSSRIDARGDSVSDITGLKNNDIFIVRQNEKGEWKAPEVLESEINTTFDEGVTSISSDGLYLYYTFSSISYDTPSTTKIYYSRNNGSGGWNAGKELIISRRDTSALFAHPSISPDGKWLYFVSNMSGGYGGKDIWRAYVSNSIILSYENLGPDINTPGDEVFPYIKNDSTLYFSSDGHPSMGGLDLFEAKLHYKSNRWKVDNMGAPINSSMDDFGITFQNNKSKGLFSSNRGDVRGRDHIYSFELSEQKVFVEGFTIDSDDEFISGAIVRAVGNDGSQYSFTTKKDGTYKFETKAGIKYLLMASKEGYLNARKSLDVLSSNNDTTYFIDFEMISYSKPIVLENVFYDFDNATLRAESIEEMDALVDVLNENPNISIELSAHTDRKGTDKYNIDLSQRRAQAVINYLIKNNIDQKRLTAVGYGKTMPKEVSKSIAEKYDFLNQGDVLTEDFINNLNDEQKEVCDQINRRTEFKVIDHNFGLY